MHSQLRGNKGTIAQLVEQRTENPCVPGSIPGGTTNERITFSSSLFFILCQYREKRIISFLKTNFYVVFFVYLHLIGALRGI